MRELLKRLFKGHGSVVERALRQGNPYEIPAYLFDHVVAPRLPRWKEVVRDPGCWQRAYKELPPAQRVICNLYGFLAEVNNGAVVQYFWNSTGDTAEDLIQDLRSLGSEQIAHALESARDEIFGGSVPTGIDQRRAEMVKYFGTDPFSDDDDDDDDDDDERLAGIREAPRSDEATAVFHENESALLSAFREWAMRNKAEIES